MASAFLHTNLFDSAAYYGEIGTAALPSLPLSNLRDPQLRVRARWAPAACSLWVDLGSAQAVACVALLSTTLGLAGGSPTVRARVSNDAGFGTATWDTGAIAPETSTAAAGNVVLVNAAGSTSGRFVRIDVTDPAATTLDVGRVVIGPLWRLSYGPSFGMEEGRLILDRRDRNNFTGAEFPVPAVANPRAVNFALPLISRTEATTEWRQMLDELGAVGDALWIPDDGLAQAELNARSIWGAVSQPGGLSMLTRANFVGHTRAFSIVERV